MQIFQGCLRNDVLQGLGMAQFRFEVNILHDFVLVTQSLTLSQVDMWDNWVVEGRFPARFDR